MRAPARQAAAVRPPPPQSKPTSPPAEESPEPTTTETASGNTKVIENDSMAARAFHSSAPATESVAWGPATITSTEPEMRSATPSSGDEHFNATAVRSTHSSAPATESVAWGPASMTTAYAEEETAARSRGDEPLVWPITPAEPTVSARQPEPIITFVNLLCAFLAALGLVFIIVHALCGPSIVRKLGQSIIGRRPGLASHHSGSGKQFSNHAVSQAAVSRNSAERKLPKSNGPDAHIEASVQRLLQELARRQHHDRPQDFGSPTRKITA